MGETLFVGPAGRAVPAVTAEEMHAVDECTTAEALARNAEAYARLVGEYAARIDDDGTSER